MCLYVTMHVFMCVCLCVLNVYLIPRATAGIEESKDNSWTPDISIYREKTSICLSKLEWKPANPGTLKS